MSYGLRDSDLDCIVAALRKHPEIEKAILFGSRAKGTFKPGSDVDIAIAGDEITFSTIAHLHAELEGESPMPYFFDILDYSHVKNQEIRENVDRAGILIYDRSTEQLEWSQA